MTRRFYRQVLVATSLLAFGVTIRPVEATNPASWKAGQAVVYKGSAALTQSAGGEENKVEFSASELAIARKSGDTTKLLVARAIFPKADGAMPEGAYNEFDVNGDEIFAHDAPMEVDGAQHILGVYIPLRVSVPRKEATKVAILGQAYVPVTAKLTTAQEEKGTRYTASLPEGKTQGFEFRASPGTLLAWKESYLVSKDGVILEKSFSYEFEVDIQGNKVKAGVSCDLKAEAPVATSDARPRRFRRGAHRTLVPRGQFRGVPESRSGRQSRRRRPLRRARARCELAPSGIDRDVRGRRRWTCSREDHR